MTDFGYAPLNEPSSFYDFPDDFEFGCGENDDEVFEQAWNTMKSWGFVPVQFEGSVDPDVLERAGAVLSRLEVPDQEQYRGMDPQLALRDLYNLDVQAIFQTNADAHVAAMMFGGWVIK